MTTFRHFLDTGECVVTLLTEPVWEGMTFWKVDHPLSLGTIVCRYPTGLYRCTEHPGVRDCAEIEAVRKETADA